MLSNRYLPHELQTRFHAVSLYRTGVPVAFVCRRYHISKSSLMRWNKRFDGSMESLADKSHKPLTVHPASHTDEEITWIHNYMKRTPSMSVPELYGKLKKDKGYKRNIVSLYRVMRKLGYMKKVPTTKSKRKNQPYTTPMQLGLKWQLDVKYVPTACYVGMMPDKFYQYTVIDEASRKRFIYAYKEQSGYSTVDFIKRAIKFFGYKPATIQTDNGAEFTNIAKTDKIHTFDLLCNELGIEHKLIRPRTPRHNGKVERSHRNDQERFYDYLKFYDYNDLLVQMSAYRKRANNIPSSVLGWKSPNEMDEELKEFNTFMQQAFAC